MLKVKDVDIYNSVFMMHTKLTVVFLLVFSVLGTYFAAFYETPHCTFLSISFSVSAHEFFGKPINCIIGDKDLQTFAENNCWINGTFTMRNVTKSKN